MVNVVQSDLHKEKINFVYSNRRNHNQALSIGSFIKKLEPNIPGGILIFFPSYEMMQFMTAAWDEAQLKFERETFQESKSSKEFDELFKKYRKRISKGKKAMLLCVCRGKLSEGIDFMDDAARAIFLLGIPYPCVNDPRVVQKQEYLDQKHHEEPNFEIDGQKWYRLQASRTVNQAIGRVIRHVHDYGAIFLMDERYASSTIEISKWMKERKRIYGRSNIDRLHDEVKHFF